LQEEVQPLRSLLHENDEELHEVYVDRQHCVAATGAEGQLLDVDENPPPLSMWQKMKYEGRIESHEQLFFACELGTADEGEYGGKWNQLLCYP